VTALRPPLDIESPPDVTLLGAILEDAGSRRLVPFFYLQAQPHASDLPAQLLRQLRASYLATLRRNLFLHKELGRLLEAFAAERIDVLPLKGTLLGLRLYGDLARPTTDIDLLVRREEFQRAREVLTRQGYDALDDAGRYDVHFLRHSGPVLPLGVELHRSLDHFTRIGEGFVDCVWAGAAPVRDHDLGLFWRMDPAEELLYLCLNLCRHRFEDPFLALDVHLACERWGDQIDWDRFIETCARCRLRYPVALALAFTQHWFRTAFPEEVPSALALPRWRKACFEWAEWHGNIDHVLRHVPLAQHVHIALRLPLLDETWQDRFEHISFVARTCKRVLSRRLRKSVGGPVTRQK
jgi:hypothetical protein